MDVVVVPDAELQIRTIDGWWRENRLAAPGLFIEELAAAIDLIASAPRASVAVGATGESRVSGGY